jgi:uncharacterized membrane protein
MKSAYLALLIGFFIFFGCSQVFGDTISNKKVNADSIHQMSSANPTNSTNDASVRNFPNYHPLVVHFPIVLLLFAAFLQLLAFWKKELNIAVIILLICGTLGAWLAAEIFDAHPNFKGLTQEAKNIFRLHHQFADYTTWLSTAALLVKIFAFFVTRKKIFFEILACVLLISSAVTVCVSGHYGSYLVHVEGVGPKGNQLKQE